MPPSPLLPLAALLFYRMGVRLCCAYGRTFSVYVHSFCTLFILLLCVPYLRRVARVPAICRLPFAALNRRRSSAVRLAHCLAIALPDALAARSPLSRLSAVSYLSRNRRIFSGESGEKAVCRRSGRTVNPAYVKRRWRRQALAACC